MDTSGIDAAFYAVSVIGMLDERTLEAITQPGTKRAS
jgi:hypothetical protein